MTDHPKEAFDLTHGFASSPLVKLADHMVYYWECRDLRGEDPPPGWEIPADKLVPWGICETRERFLQRWNEVL